MASVSGLLATQFFEQSDCPVGAHVVLGGHALGDGVDLVAGGTRDQCDVAGVQDHVAVLDAFGGQGTQGAGILVRPTATATSPSSNTTRPVSGRRVIESVSVIMMIPCTR